MFQYSSALVKRGCKEVQIHTHSLCLWLQPQIAKDTAEFKWWQLTWGKDERKGQGSQSPLSHICIFPIASWVLLGKESRQREEEASEEWFCALCMWVKGFQSKYWSLLLLKICVIYFSVEELLHNCFLSQRKWASWDTQDLWQFTHATEVTWGLGSGYNLYFYKDK